MLPRFTLRQLSYFVTIAESGSISAAAAQLHVSESAVNLALTELERAIGAQLCVRRRARGVELTASGRDLMWKAARLLTDAEALQQGIDDPVSGTVSLGCTPGLSPQMLPPIVAGCATQLPGVTVEFELLESPRLIDQLIAGATDLAIVSNVRLFAQVATHTLCVAPVHVVLPGTHPLARQDVVDLADLADDPCILLEVAPGAEHAMDLFARSNVTPRIRYRTSSYELARSLVARGLGYSLQTVRPASDLSYEGLALAPRPITISTPGEGVVIAWNEHRRPSRAAQAVIALATQLWRVEGRQSRLDRLDDLPSGSTSDA